MQPMMSTFSVIPASWPNGAPKTAVARQPGIPYGQVAPPRQRSMPSLELCAAVSGAQLAKLTGAELTLPLQDILWTDSTTVLTWLKSDSSWFKVYVGTRIAEVQELTGFEAWRYVNSEANPADDLT